jgi:hypothetical protein
MSCLAIGFVRRPPCPILRLLDFGDWLLETNFDELASVMRNFC